MDRKIRKNKQSYTFADMYQSYLRENNAVELSYVDFKRILDEMCNIILERVLEASDGFKMPFGLGFIQVGKYLPKGYTSESLSVDYKASKQYNKKIYHLNEHSNGYKYRLFWSKIPRTFPDRYRYQLSLVRQNKRKLAQLIFNNKDYIDINDIQFYKV